MILPIIAFGSTVLKKKAKDLSNDYPNVKQLIENMWETMYASNGVGLAAPQIGLSLRLFIVDTAPFADDETLDIHQGFFDMGIDSLSAVELRNQLHRALGVNMPPTIAFNHPSVAKLTTYILSKQEGPPAEAEPIRQEAIEADADGLDQLSENELADLLDQEMDQAEEQYLR